MLVGSWLVAMFADIWKIFQDVSSGTLRKHHVSPLSPPAPKDARSRSVENIVSRRIMITRHVKLPGFTRMKAESQKVSFAPEMLPQTQPEGSTTLGLISYLWIPWFSSFQPGVVFSSYMVNRPQDRLQSIGESSSLPKVTGLFFYLSRHKKSLPRSPMEMGQTQRTTIIWRNRPPITSYLEVS